MGFLFTSTSFYNRANIFFDPSEKIEIMTAFKIINKSPMIVSVLINPVNCPRVIVKTIPAKLIAIPVALIQPSFSLRNKAE